jgi:hypothetical protein
LGPDVCGGANATAFYVGQQGFSTPSLQWAELDILPVAKMFYKLAGKACFVADNVILGRRMS